jgi:hypothetical protein
MPLNKSVLTLFPIAFLLTINIFFAQDSIYKRNGDIITAKVLEISSSEVTYKRLDLPNGPMFSEDKANISFIKYSNGNKEEFQVRPLNTKGNEGSNYVHHDDNKIYDLGWHVMYHDKYISERDMKKILLQSNDKTIINLALKSDRARKVSKLGFVAIPFAFAATISGLVYLGSSSDVDAGAFTLSFTSVALPIAIAGIINNHNHSSYRRDAIKLYNQKY